MCFRYNDKSIENLNQFNSELHCRLIENGNYMISKSIINGNFETSCTSWQLEKVPWKVWLRKSYKCS